MPVSNINIYKQPPPPQALDPTKRPYTPHGAARKMFYSKDLEILLDGPADTGKSRACLEKLHICAGSVPGIRCLILRKTTKSLRQTTMITFEQKVLPPFSGVRFHTTRQAYLYPNGSEIAIGGMDDPMRHQSSEYDLIFVPEATELLEDEIEILTKLLRNGVLPFQQLLLDCNPSYPTHWLNQRCEKGLTTRLLSRHEDNPSLTEERLERLKRLTGVRHLRLYKGIWCAAEGMIYDQWDRRVHIIHRSKAPAQFKRIIAGIDWGYTNPGVIIVFGIDGDDRAYLLHEVYRVKMDVDTYWIPKAQYLCRKFNFNEFYPDPSEPAYIEKFRSAGLNCKQSDNAVQPGIQHIQNRLTQRADGTRGLYVIEDSLEERDPILMDEKKPCGFVEEIEGYCWKKTKAGYSEEPQEQDDHAMDASRYPLYTTSDRGRNILITPGSHSASNLYA